MRICRNCCSSFLATPKQIIKLKASKLCRTTILEIHVYVFFGYYICHGKELDCIPILRDDHQSILKGKFFLKKKMFFLVNIYIILYIYIYIFSIYIYIHLVYVYIYIINLWIYAYISRYVILCFRIPVSWDGWPGAPCIPGSLTMVHIPCWG